MAAGGSDFFGLNSDNSDSEVSDNEDTSRNPIHQGGDSLHKRGASQGSPSNNTESLDMRPEIPTGTFWNPGQQEVIAWDQPGKLWKHQTNDQDETNGRKLQSIVRKRDTYQMMPISHHKNIRKYIPKGMVSEKDKQTEEMSLKIGHQKANVDTALDSSCGNFDRSHFKVHWKVEPHLKSRTLCGYPKTSTCIGKEHGGPVSDLNWCSKAEYSHLLVSASLDNTVKIWNAFSKDGHALCTLRHHQKGVRRVIWSATNDAHVLSCGYDHTARLVDIVTGQQVSCFSHDHYATALALHPQNPNYFITGSYECIICWDSRIPSKPMRKCVYKDKFGQVEDMVFSQDGDQFFSCNDVVTRDSADRNIMAWDFEKGIVLSNQIYQERYTCTKLRVHPSQPQFIAQTNGDYIALFSTQRPYKMNKNIRYEGHRLEGHKIGCDFSSDGQIIVSGSSNGYLCFYNYHSSKLVKTVNTGGSPNISTVWSPVLPNVVAAGSLDGSLSITS